MDDERRKRPQLLNWKSDVLLWQVVVVIKGKGKFRGEEPYT